MNHAAAAATAAAQDERVARTAPIAMFAIARHMIDHGLPAPVSITRPSIGEREIALMVYTSDLAAWVATIHVDGTVDEPCSVRGKVRRTVQGRLDNGVRLSITTVVPALDEPLPVYDVQPVGLVGARGLEIVRSHALPTCTSLDGCREPVLPADSTNPGCPHGDSGAALCADHLDQCSLCRDDRRQDRSEGWL